MVDECVEVEKTVTNSVLPDWVRVLPPETSGLGERKSFLRKQEAKEVLKMFTDDPELQVVWVEAPWGGGKTSFIQDGGWDLQAPVRIVRLDGKKFTSDESGDTISLIEKDIDLSNYFQVVLIDSGDWIFVPSSELLGRRLPSFSDCQTTPSSDKKALNEYLDRLDNLRRLKKASTMAKRVNSRTCLVMTRHFQHWLVTMTDPLLQGKFNRIFPARNQGRYQLGSYSQESARDFLLTRKFDDSALIQLLLEREETREHGFLKGLSQETFDYLAEALQKGENDLVNRALNILIDQRKKYQFIGHRLDNKGNILIDSQA